MCRHIYDWNIVECDENNQSTSIKIMSAHMCHHLYTYVKNVVHVGFIVHWMKISPGGPLGPCGPKPPLEPASPLSPLSPMMSTNDRLLPKLGWGLAHDLIKLTKKTNKIDHPNYFLTLKRSLFYGDKNTVTLTLAQFVGLCRSEEFDLVEQAIHTYCIQASCLILYINVLNIL